MQEQEFAEIMVQSLDKLIKATTNQRLCPEILPFQKELVCSITQQRKRQQESLEAFQGDTKLPFLQKQLKSTIYKMEIERINYILKHYLRVRLMKIQTYAFHLIKSNNLDCLSAEEQEFVIAYAQIRYEALNETALNSLHKDFKGLNGIQRIFGPSQQPQHQTDEKAKKVGSKQSVVDFVSPNKNLKVFIRILANPSEIRYQEDIKVCNLGEEDRKIVMRDDYIMLPYKDAERLIRENLAELV